MRVASSRKLSFGRI